MIKDSGNRTEFESGAVRDIQDGKGRCDLLPLEVAAQMIEDEYGYEEASIIRAIEAFKNSGCQGNLYAAMCNTKGLIFISVATMLLEVAIHFEDGAEKYGDRNWEKGIPTDRYIDSAVRHYLKYLRGDTDERHDRAFIWNIMCCIWTCENKPELNTYAK